MVWALEYLYESPFILGEAVYTSINPIVWLIGHPLTQSLGMKVPYIVLAVAIIP